MEINLTDKSEWHKVFCLFPVVTRDNKFVWLSHVYRREKYVGWEGEGSEGYVYEYVSLKGNK